MTSTIFCILLVVTLIIIHSFRITTSTIQWKRPLYITLWFYAPDLEKIGSYLNRASNDIDLRTAVARYYFRIVLVTLSSINSG